MMPQHRLACVCISCSIAYVPELLSVHNGTAMVQSSLPLLGTDVYKTLAAVDTK